MAGGVFNKEILRSITHSFGRFFAIAVIAALGTGFYAGLRMTAPDMKIAGDQYYDATNLCDIRVMSTLGLSDEDIAMLRDVEGVEAVMPAYETDAIADIDGSQYTVRVHSLDTEAARASDTSSGSAALSDEDGYINRPVLVSGSWPTEPGECVLGADVVMDTEVAVGDTVRLLEGVQDLEDTLKETEFTVTGFVRSSYYASPTNLGTTSLGNGIVDQFVYVPEADFSSDSPYTEAFVTVKGAREEFASSAAYDEVVAQVVQRLEGLTPTINAARLDEVKGEAQRELDDRRAEYEAERADAQAQLDEARQKLDDAKAQLEDAEATLASSEARLESGRADYYAGAAQLEDERASAQDQMDDAQAQLDEGRAQLETAWSQAGISYDEAKASLAALQQGIAGVEGRLASLPDGPEYDEARAQLQQQLAALKGQEASLGTLISSQDALDASQAELDAQRQSANEQFASAEARLSAAWAQLESGQDQLESGRLDYESGVAEYEEGLAEYERQKADAEEQFADAEEQLADAQKQIDDIADPEFYVLDRSKLIGAESFESDANRVDQIAQVFPFIFFLVAALVSLTTMTRMVDEERILIGTHKALGYRSGRITSKYLIYALVASGAGSVVGLIALTQFLPYFIMNAYAIVYAVPPRPTPIDPGIAALSAGLGIGITVLATWAAVGSTLREVPAALMQPRAPKAGKRILLERVKPLWRRLSFSWKVTARNIFRYKQRFFMAIVGIAGCTALLLTGLGLQNAINDIINKQFYEIYQYSMTVRTDEDMSKSDRAALDEALDDPDWVSEHMWMHTANVVGVSEGHDEQRLELVVPQDPALIGDYVVMRERVGGTPIPLEDDGAVVSEKLARQLGLSVGDSIVLYEEDSIGNATGQPHEMKIAGIMENYVSQYLFATPAAYERSFGEEPSFATVYAKTTDDAVAREAMSEQLLSLEGVKTVGYNDEQIDTYRTMLTSVDSVVVVLVVAAAALAFVVLYNLTNINITERKREIATLKVLGFTRAEVNAYIFREAIILSVIGALAGLALGIVLEAFVVQTAEVDQVMFGRDIHAASFIIAFVLTMVFTVLVMLVMRRKLARIDMVESLKAVE